MLFIGQHLGSDTMKLSITQKRARSKVCVWEPGGSVRLVCEEEETHVCFSERCRRSSCSRRHLTVFHLLLLLDQPRAAVTSPFTVLTSHAHTRTRPPTIGSLPQRGRSGWLAGLCSGGPGRERGHPGRAPWICKVLSWLIRALSVGLFCCHLHPQIFIWSHSGHVLQFFFIADISGRFNVSQKAIHLDISVWHWPIKIKNNKSCLWQLRNLFYYRNKKVVSVPKLIETVAG